MNVYFKHKGLSLCYLRLLLFKPISVFRINQGVTLISPSNLRVKEEIFISLFKLAFIRGSIFVSRFICVHLVHLWLKLLLNQVRRSVCSP